MSLRREKKNRWRGGFRGDVKGDVGDEEVRVRESVLGTRLRRAKDLKVPDRERQRAFPQSPISAESQPLTLFLFLCVHPVAAQNFFKT